MANLKALLMVAAALVATCQSVKPPGFVERPPVHDESPPNYAFDYEVRDHQGGSQGHNEVRKGIFAVGGYYSRLPGESGAQRVAYYADDWGFHPVLVAYGGRGYSTRLAFGDKAVATANAAAGTDDFRGSSAVHSIGVHVPETVNPLPDLTQTGAAALAAENPQKPDADELLASVGQPPAPPQPAKSVVAQKTVQAIGVIPVVNAKVSAPAVHSVAASSVVYGPPKLLPPAAAYHTINTGFGSHPISSHVVPTASHVAPAVSLGLSPAIATHSTSAIATGSVASHVSPAIATNVAPAIASHAVPAISSHLVPAVPSPVPPPISLGVHTAPATSTHYVRPVVATHDAAVLNVQGATETAAGYIAPVLAGHAAAAVSTGHVSPAGTTYIASAAPTYAAATYVAPGGTSYDASSLHAYIPPAIAVRKPTPRPFFISTTPAPVAVIAEGVHEVKTNEEAVFQSVSVPSVSYVSSSPATVTKETLSYETSTVAPVVLTQERDHIKESSAAAAAAAASALAAAAATGSGGSYSYQDSSFQSEQQKESYYSKSSHNIGAATSFSSSSFSSSGGINQGSQELEANSQQEYIQNGGYGYDGSNQGSKESVANAQLEYTQDGGYSYAGINEGTKEIAADAQQEYNQDGRYNYAGLNEGTKEIAADEQQEYNQGGRYSYAGLNEGAKAVAADAQQEYNQDGRYNYAGLNEGTKEIAADEQQEYNQGGRYSYAGLNEGAKAVAADAQQEYYQDGVYRYDGLNEATKEIAADIQQQYNQDGRYSYEASKGIAANTQQGYNQNIRYSHGRPTNDLTHPQLIGTTYVGIQPSSGNDQNYQYKPTVASGNYHYTGFVNNPGFHSQYHARPQLVSNEESAFSFSSSSKTSSASSSGINSGVFGGSSFGSQGLTASKPQVATSIQSHIHQAQNRQPYPFIPPTETNGNIYQYIRLQLGDIGLEGRTGDTTTPRPQPGVNDGFRPIVVAEIPRVTTTLGSIQETSTLAPPTLSPTFAPDFSFPTTTYSNPTTIDVTTPNPITQSEGITPFYSVFPSTSLCRNCNRTRPDSRTYPTPTTIEATTPIPITSSDSITPFYSDVSPPQSCRPCNRNKPEFRATPPPPTTVEVTTPTPITSSEAITPFYSTFPDNAICVSCQYTKAHAITLLTAPATDSTASTLDEELQQVFFGGTTASLDSEAKEFETTASVDVTPRPFSVDETVSDNPTKQTTVNLQAVEDEENRGTTISTSSFEDYSQTSGSLGDGLTVEKDRQSFSEGSIGGGRFPTGTGTAGGQSFTSGGDGEIYSSGGGNQILSGAGDQFYSNREETNAGTQGFGGGSQTFEAVSGGGVSGGGGVFNGDQVYQVSSTPATPVRPQGVTYAVRPTPPSVLYVDRPVAVPVPYAVPQFVPYAVRGSSYKGGSNRHRISSSSSSGSAFESSTPSVISVTQITKIRTSGRKGSDRGYVKQIVEESAASGSEEEEEEYGQEVVIKGGSVKVRPGNYRQQGYFRSPLRPAPFRLGSDAGASGTGPRYGDRIRVERPRKLCIEYGDTPVVHSHPDHSQFINLR